MIVKVKDSDEILGEYNPIKWKKSTGGFGSYGTTKDSFIFSFDNNKIENVILSRVMDENKAIFNGSLIGPSFGNGDLIIWKLNVFENYKSFSRKNSYEKPIRKTENDFTVEECEVFQIIKD